MGSVKIPKSPLFNSGLLYSSATDAYAPYYAALGVIYLTRKSNRAEIFYYFYCRRINSIAALRRRKNA